MSALAHALDLAARGRAVFPMVPATKRPAYTHGVNDATRCTEIIRSWFSRSGLVPAVATGEPSGVVVLDLDRQHNGAVWWENHRNRLPATEIYRTRSGGLHLVFLHRPGIRTVAIGKIGAGVEIRSTGASAIFWPAYGLRRLSDSPPADLPAWLSPPLESRSERHPTAPRAPDDATIDHLMRFAMQARPGERNRRLFWTACRLAEQVRHGTLGSAYAIGLIEHAGVSIGLPLPEARATAHSAILRGEK
jgi:hypothetical protein